MIEFLLCCNELCFTICQGTVVLSAQGTCIKCYRGLTNGELDVPIVKLCGHIMQCIFFFYPSVMTYCENFLFLISLWEICSFSFSHSLSCIRFKHRAWFLSTLFRFLDRHFNLATMNCHQKEHYWIPELLISCKLLSLITWLSTVWQAPFIFVPEREAEFAQIVLLEGSSSM